MSKSIPSCRKRCGRLVKAIVFKSALGLTDQDVEFLKEAILKEISKSEAEPKREDQYGKRYTVAVLRDVIIRNLDKEATNRTGWIIKKSEEEELEKGIYEVEFADKQGRTIQVCP